MTLDAEAIAAVRAAVETVPEWDDMHWRERVLAAIDALADDPELDAYAASFAPARHADQGLRFNPDGSVILEDGS